MKALWLFLLCLCSGDVRAGQCSSADPAAASCGRKPRLKPTSLFQLPYDRLVKVWAGEADSDHKVPGRTPGEATAALNQRDASVTGGEDHVVAGQEEPSKQAHFAGNPSPPAQEETHVMSVADLHMRARAYVLEALRATHATLTLSTTIAIAVAALLSMICSGATGFGESMVFQWGFYLLSLFGLTSGHMAESGGLLAVWSWPLSWVQVWILREHLNWTLTLTIGLCACVTCIPAALICAHYDNVWLKFSFGCFLALAFAWQVYRMDASADIPQADETQAPSKPHNMFNLMIGTGLVAGFSRGLFGASGPVMIVFALVSKASKDEIRATFACMDVFLHPLRLCVLVQIGAVSMQSLSYNSLWATPSGFVGLMLGNYLTRFLSQSVWQRCIIFILLAAGTSFLMAPFMANEKT